MITINRKDVDKLLKEMDLFVHTKVAVAAYKEELKQLEERGEKLSERLAAVQAEHTDNLLKLDGCTDVDQIITLKFENINLVANSKVVMSLLEALEEEKTEHKVGYAPVFEAALRADMQARQGKYNANLIVDELRYEMIRAIADIGLKMKEQFFAIEADVKEVFDDVAVQETHVKIGRGFTPEHYQPTYSEFSKTVISKQDIFTAISGQMPPNIRKPEGVTK